MRAARRLLYSTTVSSSSSTSSFSNLWCGGGKKREIHSSAVVSWKNYAKRTVRLTPPERGAEAPMTSFEAGVKQQGWGKAGGGMSPFTPTRKLKKRKTYQKRAGHMIETLERERITEILKERPDVNISPFRVGDVVRLTLEVPENRRRRQIFTGICIARKNRGLGSSFMLRTMLGNVAIERLFPLYAPMIKDLTVLDRKKVRRAKLYYLRDRPARFSRV